MTFYKSIAFVTIFISASCNEMSDNVSEDINQKEAVIETESWDKLSEDSSALDYIQFIKSEFLNKAQTIKTDYGKEEITYLGHIIDQNGNVVSYVLSLYAEVQAAIQIHGHSNIIFIHNDLKRFKRYDLGVPEELPFKLENNNLYFHYTDKEEKVQTFIDTVGTTLPKLICVGPENCY